MTAHTSRRWRYVMRELQPVGDTWNRWADRMSISPRTCVKCTTIHVGGRGRSDPRMLAQLLLALAMLASFDIYSFATSSQDSLPSSAPQSIEMLEPQQFAMIGGTPARSAREYLGRSVLYSLGSADEAFDSERYLYLTGIHERWAKEGLSVIVIYIGSPELLRDKLREWRFEYAYAIETHEYVDLPLWFRFGKRTLDGYLLVSPEGVLKTFLPFETALLERAIRDSLTGALREPMFASRSEVAVNTLARLRTSTLGATREYVEKASRSSPTRESNILCKALAGACKAEVSNALKLGKAGYWLEASERLRSALVDLEGTPEIVQVRGALAEIDGDPEKVNEIKARSELVRALRSLESVSTVTFRMQLRRVIKRYPGTRAAEDAMAALAGRPATPP